MPRNHRTSLAPPAWIGALLVLAALGAGPASAAKVYKCPSPEGGVTYSDIPCPGGEPMEIYIPPPPEPAGAGESAETGAGAKPDAPPFAGYRDVSIVSPGGDEALRDPSGAGSVPVALAISPALRTDLGHAIAAYVDGRPWPGRFSSPQFALSGLDQGAHTLRAAVTDAAGRQLATSGTVSFTLLRTTAELPEEGVAPPDLPYPRPGGELPYPRPGGDPPYPPPMPRPPRAAPR